MKERNHFCWTKRRPFGCYKSWFCYRWCVGELGGQNERKVVVVVAAAVAVDVKAMKMFMSVVGHRF